MNGTVATLLFILVFALVCSLPYLAERWRFNKGTCRCGCKFDLREYDSQGDRQYTCESCGYTVWVTYDSIDRAWRADK